MRPASLKSHAAVTSAPIVGALGIVFGDIGTSPLYAMQAALAEAHPAAGRDDVYGPVSLVFWTLTLIVTVKYVTFILRADNDGEGGSMALIALVQRARAPAWIVALGAFGAALFYGDGMITPAISVLSAVEGLKVAAPGLGSLSVPIALAVLVALFSVQRFGTGAVGRVFGPLMVVWFAAIALVGFRQVVEDPGILAAVSPTYAVGFLIDHGTGAAVVLGSVVLTVTGAEALYADVGHFGRSPIRRAWLLIVFPALMLNYAGQGALVLERPSTVDSPFFHMAPAWAQMPMVVLATMATVIASQAVISGVFSVTHQAVQLGFLPRLTIRHTSEHERGQVYAPAVNWALCAAVAGLVVGFGSSVHLASAYGVAVTGTMVITSVLFLVVVRRLWRWSARRALAAGAVFLTVDLTLFGASLTKLPHGGWLPLAVAAAVFSVLMIWRRGRDVLDRAVAEREGTLRAFVDELHRSDPAVVRSPGTGIFLHANRDTAPLSLRAVVDHGHVLHRSVVIILIETRDVPHVDPGEGVRVDDLGYRDDGISHVTARFGYRDRHDVPRALRLASERGLEQAVDPSRASYFVSRLAAVPGDASTMPSWSKRFFIALWRNQADPALFFALPEERTVLMGSVIDL